MERIKKLISFSLRIKSPLSFSLKERIKKLIDFSRSGKDKKANKFQSQAGKDKKANEFLPQQKGQKKTNMFQS